MKQSVFGDLQPENYADLVELFSTVYLVLVSAEATVTFQQDPEGSRFDGWSATIDGQDSEAKHLSISTCGWQDREALIADLRAAGVRVIMDEKGKAL